MTYDLVLAPAPGPGLGHLMRCKALAEEALELGAKVVVALQEPEPRVHWGACAVSVGGPCPPWYWGNLVVLDGDQDHWGATPPSANSVAIVDEPYQEIDADLYVYPHFGAKPLGGPTLFGPQYMPLRKAFTRARSLGGGGVVHYRAPVSMTRPLQGRDLGGEPPHLAPEVIAQADAALVPPSTVAYEAMALGVPVRLHTESITRAHRRIGDAMVVAGEASWGSFVKAEKSQVDGLGASRIIEWIM